MDRKLLAVATALAFVTPALGNSVQLLDSSHRSPNLGWKPPRAGLPRLTRRQRRDPGALMRRSWPEIPCEAPDRFFWKRQLAGNQNWRLYKRP